jgi:capsular polysaccharide biosynthesis protein
MKNKEYLDFTSAFKIILNNKKLIIGGSFLFSVLVAVGTLFLDNYYLSQAKFYTINSMQLSPKAMYGEEVQAIYGDSKEVDRVVSVAISNAVKDYVINKYDLMTHYEIDTTKPSRRTKLFKQYNSNITVNNNDRGAIEVKVYDTDPKMAALIANDIVLKTNNQCVDNVRYTIRETMNIQEAVMNTTQSYIFSLQDSLTKVSKEYGIIISTTYEGSTSSSKAVKGWEKYLEGIDIVTSIRSKLIILNEQYALALDGYTKANQTLNAKQSALIVIEDAIPSDIKSKPIRSLIAIASFILALFLLVLYVTFKDYYYPKLSD